MSDELLFSDETELFADEDTTERPRAAHAPWKVLIVDDDPEVHEVTKFALGGFSLEDRDLQFISAYSGEEGRQVLEENPDTALILLDVVMEEDDSGLKLARTIREDLKNHLSRIILRTGQPGQAPEEEVILAYDINDYKTKGELTAQKLFTTVVSSLRSYRDIEALNNNKKGLEKIIEATASIFEIQSMEKLVAGVLTQLISLLRMEENSLYCHSSSFVSSGTGRKLYLMAGTGSYADINNRPLDEVVDKEVLADIEKAIEERTSLYLADRTVAYFRSKSGSDNLIYLQGCEVVNKLDRQLLEIFCANASTAFDNIRLNQEIENTQREVIYLLGNVTENRSKETGAHVKRVAEYCRLLAEQAGLSPDEVELIAAAAPMHDVGKVAIADDILNKPARLTEEEFEAMKAHSDIGYSMLCTSKRPILKAAAIIAHQHHERYDGGGYPQGLKGENIHLYGRIGAIADVFDALATDRCYKPAWEPEKIRTLLEEEKGQHFDPELCQIALDNFERMLEIRDTYI